MELAHKTSINLDLGIYDLKNDMDFYLVHSFLSEKHPFIKGKKYNWLGLSKKGLFK